MWTALVLCAMAAEPLGEARGHLEHGRYEEALEAYQEAGKAGADAAAALGVSRVLIETGRYDEAAEAVGKALEEDARNADLLARRGELRLLRGDWEGARADAEAALAEDEEHPAARWVKAEALTETGLIDEAVEECRWFVRYYNRAQPTDVETLVYVAKGSLRYARWKRATSIFGFVVNQICREISKQAPEDWRADAISGALLLEKYNEAQGMPDLKGALAKNPNAAAVQATLAVAALDDYDLDEAGERADAALKVHPAQLDALGVKADLAVIEGEFAAARETLTRALAVNPRHQDSLGRLAAVEFFEMDDAEAALDRVLSAAKSGDASGLKAESPIETIAAELLSRNKKPGAFLSRLAATLESRRAYRGAERAYETAVAVMPELPEPQVALGLLSMRAGEVGRAKEILDAAFKADPFHVRVNNMRKVVGLLQTYETVETPHFLIRFDAADDRVLAELTAEYLEEAYPQLTAEFGFEPPAKTVVELFHAGNGQSGREWFSARMVGLPWLQTVGASTGLMIAMASPTSGTEYNWARVVRHEFTHVITLQQTDFRIPHWYTEALAVRSEGYPRPEEWDALLRERIPKGELRTLDDLNAAFIRPGSGSDWQFAYCQSLIYAEHIDEAFGPEVHRRLLDAYEKGLPTERGIAEATGVAADEFEKGYRKRLETIAEELGPAPSREAPEEVVEAFKAAAGPLRRKKWAEAIPHIEAVFDEKAPDRRVLELLGKLKLATGDADRAAELFALGRERFPKQRGWVKLLAAALIEAEKPAEYRPLLEEIAVTDADDAQAAKKLAEMSAAEKDHASTKKWAMRALYVTPDDTELHGLLAEACDGLGEKERAAVARRHKGLVEEVERRVKAESSE